MPIKNLHRTKFLWANGRGHNQKPILCSRKNDTLGLGHSKYSHLTTHASIFEDAFNSTLKNLTVSTTIDEKGETVVEVGNKETEEQAEERLAREKVRKMISRWGAIGGWITFVRGGLLRGSRELGVAEGEEMGRKVKEEDVKENDRVHQRKRKHKGIEEEWEASPKIAVTMPARTNICPPSSSGTGESDNKRQKRRKEKKDNCRKEREKKEEIKHKNKMMSKDSSSSPIPPGIILLDSSIVSSNTHLTPHQGLGINKKSKAVKEKKRGKGGKEKINKKDTESGNIDVKIPKRPKNREKKMRKGKKDEKPKKHRLESKNKSKDYGIEDQPPKKKRKIKME